MYCIPPINWSLIVNNVDERTASSNRTPMYSTPADQYCIPPIHRACMQTMQINITAMMASVGYLEILLAFILFLFLCHVCSNKGLPWNWPVVGMWPAIIFHFNRIHDKCTEILQRSNGTFLIKGAWFTNTDILATSDPANVHYIMSKNFSNYPKGSEYKEIFVDAFGEGIFNVDLDEWRSQRKGINAMFNHKMFQQYAAKILPDNLERGLIPVLEHVSQQDILVDLQDLFQRLTLDDTCILVTGYDPCSLRAGFPYSPFSKAMDEVGEAAFLRHMLPTSFWKLLRWLGLGKEKNLGNAHKTLYHVAAKYLLMKQEELISKGTIKLEGDEEGFDALTFYLAKNDIVGPTPNDKAMKDAILCFIFGGRDTVSATLTWFFWLISKNPQVEAKIVEEIQANLPIKEGQKIRGFNREELTKLVCLHGALCETLRLFPAGPLLPRIPLQPDILPSGHRVHPKMKVMVSPYAMGRMESIWGNDCLEFKPERWISEKGTIKHEPTHKFSSFSAGPRICPGKELAFMRMKAVAAAIIQNYHVQVVEAGQPAVTPSASIFLHMKHGLMAKLQKRWA